MLHVQPSFRAMAYALVTCSLQPSVLCPQQPMQSRFLRSLIRFPGHPYRSDVMVAKPPRRGQARSLQPTGAVTQPTRSPRTETSPLPSQRQSRQPTRRAASRSLRAYFDDHAALADDLTDLDGRPLSNAAFSLALTVASMGQGAGAVRPKTAGNLVSPPLQPPPAKPASKSWANITEEEHQDRNDEREHREDGHAMEQALHESASCRAPSQRGPS